MRNLFEKSIFDTVFFQANFFAFQENEIHSQSASGPLGWHPRLSCWMIWDRQSLPSLLEGILQGRDRSTTPQTKGQQGAGQGGGLAGEVLGLYTSKAGS